MRDDVTRRRAQHLREARARFKQRLKEVRERRKLCKPNPPPRYDEVYWRGLEWLDSLCR